MHPAIETSTQHLFAIVGSAHVSERRVEEMYRYLPLSEKHLPPSGQREFDAANFDEVMRALTASLSLR